MVASLFQMLIGFTGLIGFLLRFIGPLTIAPTVTLVGLALFKAAADFSGMYYMLRLTDISPRCLRSRNFEMKGRCLGGLKWPFCFL